MQGQSTCKYCGERFEGKGFGYGQYCSLKHHKAGIERVRRGVDPSRDQDRRREMRHPHPPIQALSLLRSTPDDPTECWLTAAQGEHRPKLGLGQGRGIRVSRVVLEARLGRPLAPDMHALHTCDNLLCVRPDHLFEGTHADNMRDMALKGRARGGPGIGPARKAEVRALVHEGWMKADIARAYGIDPASVWYIMKSGPPKVVADAIFHNTTMTDPQALPPIVVDHNDPPMVSTAETLVDAGVQARRAPERAA